MNPFEEDEFHQGEAISWVSNKSPRATKSKESGVIQQFFYVFDMARMLKGLLPELLFGNIGVELPTYVRNNNYKILQQAESTKSVSLGKRPNGLLEREIEKN